MAKNLFNYFFGKLRRILYWVIPVVLLYFIFKKIEINSFLNHLSKANPWFVLFGFTCYSLIILVSGLRWHFFLRQNVSQKIPFKFTAKHYWIGMLLGSFTPSSIGWDAYRVIVSAREFGKYAINIVIVVMEKLQSLFCCVVLIAALFPFMPVKLPPSVNDIIRISYVAVMVFLLLFLSLVLFQKNHYLRFVSNKVNSLVKSTIRAIAKRASLDLDSTRNGIQTGDFLKSLILAKRLFPTLSLSFGIHIIGAITNQIFFYSLSYSIPFSVNLFVVPILFLIFRLPISFGGLGIREASYVLLFGLFGVPNEIALIVSFFGLSAMLINSAVGGVFMIASPPVIDKKPGHLIP